MEVYDDHFVDAPFVGWCCILFEAANGTMIISQTPVIHHLQASKEKHVKRFCRLLPFFGMHQALTPH